MLISNERYAQTAPNASGAAQYTSKIEKGTSANSTGADSSSTDEDKLAEHSDGTDSDGSDRKNGGAVNVIRAQEENSWWK